MEDFTSRTRLLIGDDGVKRLAACRIAVIGIGGVGSFTVEALTRAGIGSFLLVDSDVITLSNLNRQLHATMDTIGRHKTLVMAERMASINPAAEVRTKEIFCLPDNIESVISGDFDYIIDAVDTVSAKLAIIKYAALRGIPVISAMGAGNKLDPARFEVADIYETSVCPLCRVMRRELKKEGIERLKVVYSKEPPVTLSEPAEPEHESGQPWRRPVPGSIAFVPATAGLILAGAAVRDLLEI